MIGSMEVKLLSHSMGFRHSINPAIFIRLRRLSTLVVKGQTGYTERAHETGKKSDIFGIHAEGE